MAGKFINLTLVHFSKLGQMFVATPPSQFLSILRGSVATNFAGICEVFFTCKLNVNSNAGFEIFNVDSNAAPWKGARLSSAQHRWRSHILIPKSRTITLQILGLLFAVQQPQQLIWVQDCRCNLREPQALPLMAPFARWNTSHNPTFGRSRLPSPSICFLLRVALHEWLNNRWNFEYAQNYFQCTLN